MSFKEDVKVFAEKYNIWYMISDMTEKRMFTWLKEIFEDLSLPYDEMRKKVDLSEIGVTEEDAKKLYSILKNYQSN